MMQLRTGAGLLLLAVAAQPAQGSASGDLQRRPRQQQTLYSRIEAAAGLGSVVARWQELIANDTRVSPFFVGTPTGPLKAHRVSFLASAFGGPNGYTGPSLSSAHSRLLGRLGLADAHFDIVVGYLSAAMLNLGVAAADVDLAQQTAEGMRSDILQHRQTGQYKPEVVLSGIGEVCPVQAGFDGAYYRAGTTADGRAFYVQDDTASTRTLYFDPSCNGGADGNQSQAGAGRWVLDVDVPSTSAHSDLDRDGKCEYVAEVSSPIPTTGMTDRQRDAPPSGIWSVFCGGECVDTDPAGCAGYLGNRAVCTTDTAIRGRCCATCSRTMAGEQAPPRLVANICTNPAAPGSPSTISCANNEVIVVTAADFGRMNCVACVTNSSCLPKYCGGGTTCNCTSTGVLVTVQRQCSNLQTCTLQPSATVFGEPCPDDEQFLRVEYECHKVSSDVIVEVQTWTPVQVSITDFTYPLPPTCKPTAGFGLSARRRLMPGGAPLVAALAGAGGTDFYSFAGCVERVRLEITGANGASMEVSTGACYALYGMNSSDDDPTMRSCAWAAPGDTANVCVDDFAALQQVATSSGEVPLLGPDCQSTYLRIQDGRDGANACSFVFRSGHAFSDVCCALCAAATPDDGGGVAAAYCTVGTGICLDSSGVAYDMWSVEGVHSEYTCGDALSYWHTRDARVRGAVHDTVGRRCYVLVDDGVVLSDPAGGQVGVTPFQQFWDGAGPVARGAGSSFHGEKWTCLVPRLDGVCLRQQGQDVLVEPDALPATCTAVAERDARCRIAKGVCVTELVPIHERSRCKELHLVSASVDDLCADVCAPATCASFVPCKTCLAEAEVSMLAECAGIARCLRESWGGPFLWECETSMLQLCNSTASEVANACVGIRDALVPAPRPGSCPVSQWRYAQRGERCGHVDAEGRHTICAKATPLYRSRADGNVCAKVKVSAAGQVVMKCRAGVLNQGEDCTSDEDCATEYCLRTAPPPTDVSGVHYSDLTQPAYWGVCALRNSVGNAGPCMRATDCVAGAQCVKELGQVHGRCRASGTVPDGASCDSNEQCAGGVCDREAWKLKGEQDDLKQTAVELLQMYRELPHEFAAARASERVMEATTAVIASGLLGLLDALEYITSIRPPGVCRTLAAPGQQCLRRLDCSDPNPAPELPTDSPAASLEYGCDTPRTGGAAVCGVRRAQEGGLCDERAGTFCAAALPGSAAPWCVGGHCTYAQKGASCTRLGTSNAAPCDPTELKCSRTTTVGTCGLLRREGDTCAQQADCQFAFRNCTSFGGCAAPVSGGNCHGDADCPQGTRCTRVFTGGGRGGAEQDTLAALARMDLQSVIEGTSKTSVCVAEEDAGKAAPLPSWAMRSARPGFCDWVQSKREGQRCMTLASSVGADNCDTARGLLCLPVDSRGDLIANWPLKEEQRDSAKGDFFRVLDGKCVHLFKDAGDQTPRRRYPKSVGHLFCQPAVAEFIVLEEDDSADASGRRGKTTDEHSGVCRALHNKRCSEASDCGGTPPDVWVQDCTCAPGSSHGRCEPTVPSECMEHAVALFTAARQADFEAAAARTRQRLSRVCSVSSIQYELSLPLRGVSTRTHLMWEFGNGPGATWLGAAAAAPSEANRFMCCVRAKATAGAPLRDQWTGDTAFSCSRADDDRTGVVGTVVLNADYSLLQSDPRKSELASALRRAAKTDFAVSFRLPQSAVDITEISAFKRQEPQQDRTPGASTSVPSVSPVAVVETQAPVPVNATVSRRATGVTSGPEVAMAVSYALASTRSEAASVRDQTARIVQQQLLVPADLSRVWATVMEPNVNEGLEPGLLTVDYAGSAQPRVVDEGIQEPISSAAVHGAGISVLVAACAAALLLG